MNKFFTKLKEYYKSVEEKINEYSKGSLNKVSNPSQSYVEWAIRLIDEGFEEQGIEKLETVTEMVVQNPIACVNLAMTYIKRGELDKVKPLLKKAISIDSGCAKAYLMYGIYYTANNDYKNAEHYYEIAAKLDPRLPEVFVNWAVSLVNQGKFQDAQEKFKKAIFYQPNNLVGLYLWAILDIDMGQLKPAKEKLVSVLSIQPKNPDALYHLALVYYKEENFDASIDIIKNALEIKNDNPLSYGLLASCYCKIDDYDKALGIYEELEKRNLYDEKTFILWGENAYDKKDYNSSIHAYEKVLSKNPDSEQSILGLANNYLKTEKFSEAKELFLKIVDNKQYNSEVLVGLYQIEKNNKNYKQAIEYLYDAIKSDTKNISYYYELGLLCEEIGDIVKAKDAYLKMIEYRTDNYDVYYHYAKLFMDDNPKEALRKIRTAYNSDKNNLQYAKLYIRVLIKNEHYKSALEVVNEISENYEKDYEISYLKVEALLNLNRFEPSIQILYGLPQDKKDNEMFDYLLAKAYILRANSTKQKNDINEMNDFLYYLSQKYSQNDKFMVKLKKLVETFKNEE